MFGARYGIAHQPGTLSLSYTVVISEYRFISPRGPFWIPKSFAAAPNRFQGSFTPWVCFFLSRFSLDMALKENIEYLIRL